MDWPYHLVDLSPEQRHERRIIIDRYGVYAQLSTLVPILAYQLYRLATWVYAARQRQKDAQYDAVPSSPRLKHAKLARTHGLISGLRSLLWWAEGEAAEGWGERGHWIAGGAWMSWLLFLCVHKTGDGKFICFGSEPNLGAGKVQNIPLFVSIMYFEPYVVVRYLVSELVHCMIYPLYWLQRM